MQRENSVYSDTQIAQSYFCHQKYAKVLKRNNFPDAK